MPTRRRPRLFPLPRGWTESTRSAVRHAVSLASAALTPAWARSVKSRSRGSRLAVEADRLRAEVARLTEELEIEDAGWSHAPARRRPRDGPVQPARILELRAARGGSVERTARRFLVTEDTIATWVSRLDAGGERALVRVEEPENEFPDFVTHLVRRL